MKKAKIIGAGGYGGVGITELLLGHPEVELACLVAKNDVGMPMSELYPHLAGYCDLPILEPADPAADMEVDVTFFATPDRVAMQGAQAELDRGAKVIDFSGDFRFDSAHEYAGYASRIDLETEHLAPKLLADACYGLPEVRRADLTSKTPIVGNAGCFAVSCILGLAPAAKYKLIQLKSIICDCKSAVSGAGKKPSAGFHYPSRYDQMNAYRLGGHQHVFEVEQALTELAGSDAVITFTPHVVPMARGILSTLYADLADGVTTSKVMDAYNVFHKDNQFVRMYDRSTPMGTMQVRGSNYCNLTVDVDERSNRLRVVSHIDNLMKGQAGNALQNMNLLFGFPEKMGLDRPGQCP